MVDHVTPSTIILGPLADFESKKYQVRISKEKNPVTLFARLLKKFPCLPIVPCQFPNSTNCHDLGRIYQC